MTSGVEETDRSTGKGFGEWLDVTLSNKRLRGRDLARALGVHDSTVTNWRYGRNVPSMAVCARLAEVLEVDPLRLAVTVGHVPAEIAGVTPLPVPEPTAKREAIKQQIRAIKGLTEAERTRLIRTFEDGDAPS